MLTFEQFQTNVQQWSTARGIYEHSSALAQALKAVSEVGELADATIKNDLDALKDAIGDVAVCLVNVAYMAKIEIAQKYIKVSTPPDNIHPYVMAAFVSSKVTAISTGIVIGYAAPVHYDDAFAALTDCALVNNLTMMECYEAAWDEIKDRTGHMVAGGAFVKDE